MSWRTKDNTTTTCERRFPHVPSLLDVVLEDDETTTVRDNWTGLLISAKAATEKCRHRLHLDPGIIYFLLPDVVAVTVAVLWAAVGNLRPNALKAASQEITGKAVRGFVVYAGTGMRILWGLVCAS